MAYRMWFQTAVLEGKWQLPTRGLGYRYNNFEIIDCGLLMEVFSDKGDWKCSP